MFDTIAKSTNRYATQRIPHGEVGSFLLVLFFILSKEIMNIF